MVQRFVRLERSRSQPGSGLGLSLVAAIARIHGGRLTFRNGQPGLVATLCLPAAQNEKKTGESANDPRSVPARE